MGLLDPRRKDVNFLPAISSETHRWRVGQTTYGGGPLIVRFNSSASEWVGHEALPIKLGFAVPLNAPHEGGLPSPDENDQLGEIEDVIRREVEARAKGLHVLVLTTGIMREFVFYIVPGSDIGAIHAAVRSGVASHEVQCQAVKDPNWDVYTRFAGG